MKNGSDEQQNNKRIARNTLLLYIRTLIVMVVGLLTSRVNLDSLGVENFGIYNVVGGLVVMFSSLSGALSMAISRFLTFELGRNDKESLKLVYSTSIIIQVIMALAIVLLAETVGLWFLNAKMVISAERLGAANWVFQFAMISFVISFLNVPHTASIVSHEKMGAFAYFSIFDVVLRLLIAYLTYIAPVDKLIFYASLHCVSSFLLYILYTLYCRRQFEECHFKIIWDKSTLRRMFSFTGWNFIGSTSFVLKDQGGNMLINLFSGPTVNAARGIAMQVNNAVYTFVTNFTTALNPQITKNYATENYEYMRKLVFKGARFSFYILLLLSIPILANTEFIVQLWLGKIPDHTLNFIRLVLIFSMNESLAIPLSTAMMATGNIRNYQLSVGVMQLMNIPFSYVALKLGAPVESVFVIMILVGVVCVFLRLYNLKIQMGFPIGEFIGKVYLNVLLVFGLSLIVPVALHNGLPDNLIGFLLSSVVSVIITSVVILYVGCSKSERWTIITNLMSRLPFRK